MNILRHRRVFLPRFASLLLLLALPACGGKEATQSQTEPASTAEPASADSPSQLETTDQTWTPEQMEELLAPIALYPDPILSQVLLASTNPQEVLDAGNWLLENQSLKSDALASAAREKGFTPPVIALVQSPETLDMMCREMGWTEELGQAYVNDQAAVLAAVQRLRAQAKDAGNLKSSEQMTVKEATQNGQEAITISPPSSQVVYVPQYDPVAAYAPATSAPTPAATSAPSEQKSSGSDTGSLVATGLLAFGAGILIAEAFDDDYYHGPYGYPSYWGPPMPYYPPYPYRPVYGGGFYPSYGYRPPGNYNHNFNNNTIIINQDNNYWNRFDADKPRREADRGRSPISEARPNRPELNQLNADAAKGPKHRAADPPKGWKDKTSPSAAKGKSSPASAAAAGKGTPSKSKVQGTYAGATTRAAKPSAASTTAGSKVQGTYAGAKSAPAQKVAPAASRADRGRMNQDASTRPSAAASRPTASASAPASRPASARPATTGSASASRPAASRPSGSQANVASRPQSSAISNSSRTGSSERAASARGRASVSSSGSTHARSAAAGRRAR